MTDATQAAVPRRASGRASAPGAGLARAAPYLQALPLTAILLAFFVAPVCLVFAVSFFDYQTWDILIPDFVLYNYEYLLDSSTTYRTYLNTAKLCLLAWFFTLTIGFTIAYFLAFHVRTVPMQIALFLLCTIPFWTSNVIRTISWIPLLGREGLVNQILQGLGIVSTPVEWLLYSQFAVVLGYVHLYTLFMIVPIFNSMIRIDKSIIEAARDAGANGFQILRHIIIPLAKPGMAIGTIFVVALVMGDFYTVDVLGGGGVASVGKTIVTELGYLQYPPAAANAVVLTVVTILLIVVLMRIVNIRKEL